MEIAETAEAGESSHWQKHLCKIELLLANTDERQKTYADALPEGFKDYEVERAQIQAGQNKLLAINLLAHRARMWHRGY